MDDEAIRQATKEHERLFNEEIEDLRKVVASPEGQRVIARLVSRLGVFSAVRGASPADSAFLEGKRHGGLILTELLNKVSPDALASVVSLSVNLKQEVKRD